VKENEGYNYISLEKNWKNANAYDLIVEYTDGTTSFYVPLRMMSFQKKTQIHQ
jgi:hypothetical protein